MLKKSLALHFLNLICLFSLLPQTLLPPKYASRIKQITRSRQTKLQPLTKPKEHEYIQLNSLFEHTKTLENLHFTFIVPSYNNAQWCERNVLSMLNQTYKNFHIIYIDDASTDGTATLVEKLIKQHKASNKITLIKNSERLGILANRSTAINMCKDSDICIALDGDDWLAHNDVLSLYYKIYSEPYVWITYGQYAEYPSGAKGICEAFPVGVLRQNLMRKYKYVASHLKTFRSWLFKLINTKDLMKDNKFLPAATDMAMMIPMLEMAQFHSMFVHEITCIYNKANHLSLFKYNSELQEECAQYVRSKPRYRALETAPSFTEQANTQKMMLKL